MEMPHLLFRLLHVFLGLLWVGVTLTMAAALGPVMLALGLPERKAFQLQFIPRQSVLAGVGAIGSLATGLGLLYWVYGGATGIGFRHDRGYWIILGTALGLGAWIIGLRVFVPGGKRMLELLNGQGNPSEIGPLAAKLGKMGPVALMHQLAATACMFAAAHASAVFNVLNVAQVLGTAAGFGLALLFISRKIKA